MVSASRRGSATGDACSGTGGAGGEANFFNCVFHNNYASVGGGLMTEGRDVVVSESIFYGNSCNERGSAIDLYGNGDYIISNSTFLNGGATLFLTILTLV